MKIIYLTTAMLPKDYENLLKFTKTMPNPSNQNFHSRMIELLSTNFSVKVISQRPINASNSDIKNLTYEVSDNHFYPGFSTRKIKRNIELFVNSKEIIKTLRPYLGDFIFFDMLNLNLMYLVKYIKKNFHTKVIGIITDNPANLSNVERKYVNNVLKSSSLCDGFITLTEDLNELVNPDGKKPYTVVNGVITNKEIVNRPDKEINKPYVYFSGALYERYGIRDLVNAVVKEKNDYSLVLSGHGEMSDELSKLSAVHPRVIFLGPIKPSTSLLLASKSLININPRKFDELLDKYSVPSKVIEYASLPVPLITTKTSILEDSYQGMLHPVEDNEDSIRLQINTILNNYEVFKQQAKILAEKTKELYGAESLVLKVKKLIEQFDNYYE